MAFNGRLSKKGTSSVVSEKFGSGQRAAMTQISRGSASSSEISQNGTEFCHDLFLTEQGDTYATDPTILTSHFRTKNAYGTERSSTRRIRQRFRRCHKHSGHKKFRVKTMQPLRLLAATCQSGALIDSPSRLGPFRL